MVASIMKYFKGYGYLIWMFLIWCLAQKVTSDPAILADLLQEEDASLSRHSRSIGSLESDAAMVTLGSNDDFTHDNQIIEDSFAVQDQPSDDNKATSKASDKSHTEIDQDLIDLFLTFDDQGVHNLEKDEASNNENIDEKIEDVSNDVDDIIVLFGKNDELYKDDNRVGESLNHPPGSPEKGRPGPHNLRHRPPGPPKNLRPGRPGPNNVRHTDRGRPSPKGSGQGSGRTSHSPRGSGHGVSHSSHHHEGSASHYEEISASDVTPTRKPDWVTVYTKRARQCVDCRRAMTELKKYFNDHNNRLGMQTHFVSTCQFIFHDYNHDHDNHNHHYHHGHYGHRGHRGHHGHSGHRGNRGHHDHSGHSDHSGDSGHSGDSVHSGHSGDHDYSRFQHKFPYGHYRHWFHKGQDHHGYHRGYYHDHHHDRHHGRHHRQHHGLYGNYLMRLCQRLMAINAEKMFHVTHHMLKHRATKACYVIDRSCIHRFKTDWLHPYKNNNTNIFLQSPYKHFFKNRARIYGNRLFDEGSIVCLNCRYRIQQLEDRHFTYHELYQEFHDICRRKTTQEQENLCKTQVRLNYIYTLHFIRKHHHVTPAVTCSIMNLCPAIFDDSYDNVHYHKRHHHRHHHRHDHDHSGDLGGLDRTNVFLEDDAQNGDNELKKQDDDDDLQGNINNLQDDSNFSRKRRKDDADDDTDNFIQNFELQKDYNYEDDIHTADYHRGKQRGDDDNQKEPRSFKNNYHNDMSKDNRHQDKSSEILYHDDSTKDDRHVDDPSKDDRHRDGSIKEDRYHDGSSKKDYKNDARRPTKFYDQEYKWNFGDNDDDGINDIRTNYDDANFDRKIFSDIIVHER